MHDVEALTRACRPLLGAPPCSTIDVEFADDTVLLSRTPSGTQLILHLVESEARGYGLKVNRQKLFDKIHPGAIHS
eukprot:7487254-Alexandrium_andersonii.AAC.1